KIDTGKTLTRWPVFVDHFTTGSDRYSLLLWCLQVFTLRPVGAVGYDLGLKNLTKISVGI
ncbi:hypothetical protein, partial [Shigella flexneri]|uniref:hypothetical protein n=1 Tax=Shigella flexneri TaxID=623 RepID=UPI001C08CA69